MNILIWMLIVQTSMNPPLIYRSAGSPVVLPHSKRPSAMAPIPTLPPTGVRFEQHQAQKNPRRVPQALKKPWKAPARRLVPPCPHPPGALDVITPASLDVELTVNEKNMTLIRSFAFSPGEKWKRLCDHSFLLGLPLTASVPLGQEYTVEFVSPPDRPKRKSPIIFQQWTGKGVYITGFVGTSLLMPPLAGPPRFHRFILRVMQAKIPLPPENEEGMREVTIPLVYLSRYGTLKEFHADVFVKLNTPWHYHGSTVPEKNVIANRIQWQVTGSPDKDITFFFSSQAPAEEEDGTALDTVSVQTEDSESAPLWMGLILLIASGVAGYLIFIWRKRRNENK